MTAPQFIPLAGVPTVKVSAIDYGNSIRVAYRGLPLELVRAGVVTKDMTLPGKKGTPRRDSTGRRFLRELMGRSGRLTIVRYYKDAADALALPGVAGNIVEEPMTEPRSETEDLASGSDICQRFTALDECARLALKAERMAEVLVLAVRLHVAGRDPDDMDDTLTRAYVRADFAWQDDYSDPEPVIAMALAGRGPQTFSLRRVAHLARTRLAATCIALTNRRPPEHRQPLNAYGFALAALGVLLEDDDGGGWADGLIARLTGQASAGATSEQALEAFLAFHDGDHLAALWKAPA